MKEKIIIIVLFAFVATNSFGQKSDAEKAMWRFRNSKTLKKALKHPSKAKEVYISNYTDSVFPNEDILKLSNVEQIVVHSRYALRKKKTDSLSEPTRIKIDTIGLQKLPKLKYLTLSNFDFRRFPIELCYLKDLKVLNLSVCLIDSLPDEIGNLKSLQVLALRLNYLTKLPNSIMHLDSLSIIDLANNSFKDFPKVLCEMKTLKEVQLSSPESPKEQIILSWAWPFPIHTNKIDYLREIESLKKLLLKSSVEKVWIVTESKAIKSEIEEKINSKDLFRKVRCGTLDSYLPESKTADNR